MAALEKAVVRLDRPMAAAVRWQELWRRRRNPPSLVHPGEALGPMKLGVVDGGGGGSMTVPPRDLTAGDAVHRGVRPWNSKCHGTRG